VVFLAAVFLAVVPAFFAVVVVFFAAALVADEAFVVALVVPVALVVLVVLAGDFVAAFVAFVVLAGALAVVFFAVVFFAAVPVDFVVVFFAGAFAALALVALAGAGGVPPLVPVLLAVVFAAGALVAFAGMSASSTALVDVTEGCDAAPVNAPRRSGRSPVLPCIVLGVVAGVPLAHGLQHAGRVFGCREWTEPVGAGAAEVRFDALVLHAPPPAPLHDDLHHAVHRSRPRTRVPPTALVVFRIFDSMKLQPLGGHRGRGRPTSDQRSMPVWPRE
jgi:hypothetical protein